MNFLEEKIVKDGGKIIREMGYDVQSLAIVDKMCAENGTITFREQ